MSGQLDLGTPWARTLFDAAERADLEATIPDGWVVGVSVSGDHKTVITWPTRDGRKPDEEYILRMPIRLATVAVKLAAAVIARD